MPAAYDGGGSNSRNAAVSRDPRIDEYIANAPAFAQPILNHVRERVHRVCPEVEETIKWRMPTFTYRGMLCGMAAFKQHATFGFWKHALVVGEGAQDGAMGQFGRLQSLADLPSDKLLTGYIKKAMQLNEEGIAAPRRKSPRPALKTPDDLAAALKKNRKAAATYAAFSPSCQREYVEWILEAKRDETRAKRVATAVEWMSEGKQRNWKYMAC